MSGWYAVGKSIYGWMESRAMREMEQWIRGRQMSGWYAVGKSLYGWMESRAMREMEQWIRD